MSDYGYLVAGADQTIPRNRLCNGVLGQFDPGKPVHALRVVPHFLDRGVRQLDPVLHEMDAQHPLQRRWPRAIAGHCVVRVNQCQHARLRDHRIQLCQENCPRRATLPWWVHTAEGTVVWFIVPRLRGSLLSAALSIALTQIVRYGTH